MREFMEAETREEKKPEERPARAITTGQLAVMALLTAILLAGQVGMSFLPNIEVVSLLVFVYAQIYDRKVFYIIYAFVILEGCIYGFGLWWFGYLYIWSALALIAILLRRKVTSLPVTCVVLGAYGLIFGALYAIPYFVAGGFAAGFSYWVAGIPFDLLHAGGNVIVALVLYRPVRTVLGRLSAYSISGGSHPE